MSAFTVMLVVQLGVQVLEIVRDYWGTTNIV